MLGSAQTYRSNAVTKVGGRNRLDAICIARDAGWM
jgi:two-component system response regulator DesR